MRSRLRLSGLICLTICFVVLAGCLTLLWMADRTADLLVSCMNGETPVTTIEAGDDHVRGRCWHSTEPPSSVDPLGATR